MEETTVTNGNQWSNTAKELWQKLSSVKLVNSFRLRRGRDQAPEYWGAGTEKKIKEFLGWDLE
jgi:hypothetical protein